MSYLPSNTYDLNHDCVDSQQFERVPDLDGFRRIGRGPSGNLYLDLGCYEFSSAHCQGDANFDGVVDVNDLLLVVQYWCASEAPDPPCCIAIQPEDCPGDISPNPCADGYVNVNDLLLVVGTWDCGVEGGTGDVPDSIEDCWDKCSELYPGGGDPWADCYELCLQSLCERGIAEGCDE